MIHGMINVYKESDFTSHDVVAKLRGIAGQKKIGHTGTLDPQAVGVLPVCLGNATKLCDLLSDDSKEYEAVLHLGVVTDTQDMTGKILNTRDVLPDQEEIVKVMMSFCGEYSQIPPMYSALKVHGKKLYELARQGIEIERQPRTVQIFRMDILKVKLPFVKFRVKCSRGTYIRTLCHDIGQRLGCGGAMEQLTRTRVGSFCLEDAYTLGELEKLKQEGNLRKAVVSVERIFHGYGQVQTTPEADRFLKNGNILLDGQVVKNVREKMTDSKDDFKIRVTMEGMPVRMYDSGKNFCGVYVYQSENRWYRPYKMFLPDA